MLLIIRLARALLYLVINDLVIFFKHLNWKLPTMYYIAPALYPIFIASALLCINIQLAWTCFIEVLVPRLEVPRFKRRAKLALLVWATLLSYISILGQLLEMVHRWKVAPVVLVPSCARVSISQTFLGKLIRARYRPKAAAQNLVMFRPNVGQPALAIARPYFIASF